MHHVWIKNSKLSKLAWVHLLTYKTRRILLKKFNSHSQQIFVLLTIPVASPCWEDMSRIVSPCCELSCKSLTSPREIPPHPPTPSPDLNPRLKREHVQRDNPTKKPKPKSNNFMDLKMKWKTEILLEKQTTVPRDVVLWTVSFDYSQQKKGKYQKNVQFIGLVIYRQPLNRRPEVPRYKWLPKVYLSLLHFLTVGCQSVTRTKSRANIRDKSLAIVIPLYFICALWRQRQAHIKRERNREREREKSFYPNLNWRAEFDWTRSTPIFPLKPTTAAAATMTTATMTTTASRCPQFKN